MLESTPQSFVAFKRALNETLEGGTPDPSPLTGVEGADLGGISFIILSCRDYWRN